MNHFKLNRHITAPAILISLVTFLLYLPALKNGFVNWDDDIYLQYTASLGSTASGFLKCFITAPPKSYWHPVTLVSYLADYSLWGRAPWGYHLVNIIFHALNTLLVFVLTVRLFRYSPSRLQGFSVLAAASITALFFGLHPLHVESVAWVAERKDELYSFFFILSILAYLEYAAASARKGLLYLSSLVFFILSIMSKPMALTLPFVLLVIDLYPLERLTPAGRNLKRLILEKAPFFALALASAFITMWVSRGASSSIEMYPPSARIFIGVRAYIFYLYKMVFPRDLAPYYPLPFRVEFLKIEYIGSAAIFIAITFFCVAVFRKHKIFLAAWLYYLITLFPVIGLVQVGAQAAADRFTYLPTLSLFLTGAAGAAWAVNRGDKARRATLSVMFFIFIILAGLTLRQTSIWRDSVSLWTHELDYLENSQFSEKKALNLHGEEFEYVPRTVAAYLGRATGYESIGDYGNAIKDFGKVIAMNPEYRSAYMKRGGSYFKSGDYGAAVKDFKKAIELDPRRTDGYLNLGMVYLKAGDREQALMNFKIASGLDSKETDTFLNSLDKGGLQDSAAFQGRP